MVMAALLVAVTSVLTVPSAPNPVGDPSTVWRLVDAPLAEFLQARAAQTPAHLDWTADGCSTGIPPGNSGRSFDFTAACSRHDFAYRNLKRLEQWYGCHHRRLDHYCEPGQERSGRSERSGRYWNRANRRRADQRFLADMLDDCRRRVTAQRLTCRVWARTYHRAVRLAGGP
jgi:hypothetical protein